MSETTFPPLRIAAFASGRGSNIESIIRHIHDGKLNAQLVAVISNNSGAGALQLARDHNIPAFHVSIRQFDDENAFAERLLELLREHQTDLVALAGYMKKIPASIIRAFPGKMLNIHPALLPSFGGQGLYGKFVHEAVLAYGARVSGATVHIVDEEYDTGPPVCQQCVPVYSQDTPESLAARVLKVEHEIYPRALQLYAARKITIKGRRVIILDE